MMHYSCPCDSAKNHMSAKNGSQVIGENVFSQSIFRVFLNFNMLKNIWKLMYFMIINTELFSRQWYFKIAPIKNQ